MRLDTKPGELVRYLGRNGRGIDQDKIEDMGIDVGDTFKVASLNVYSWDSEVELTPWPGIFFNSVCFENVD